MSKSVKKDLKYYLLVALLIVMTVFTILMIANYLIDVYGPKVSPEGVVQQTVEQDGQLQEGKCVKIAGWFKYNDSKYNFSLEYPQNYKIKYDNSDWPNAIIHFQDKSISESYLGTIEYWENELSFRYKYNKDPKFIQKVPDQNTWITIDYQDITNCENYQESWDKILESFKFN